MKSTSQLSEELNEFCEAYGYQQASADELQHDLMLKRNEINEQIEGLQLESAALNNHVEYLTQFIENWDNAQENEDNIRKGLE